MAKYLWTFRDKGQFLQRDSLPGDMELHDWDWNVEHVIVCEEGVFYRCDIDGERKMLIGEDTPWNMEEVK